MFHLKNLKKLIPSLFLGVCCGAYAVDDLIPQLYQQGMQHYTNKKYNAAADYLAQVVDMDSSNSQARYYLIYSLSLSGNNELALRHAKVLLAQFPEEVKYKTLVEQLSGGSKRNEKNKGKNTAIASSENNKKEIIFGGYKSLDKNSSDTYGMMAPREDYTPRDITPPKPLTELEKAVRKIDDEDYDTAEKMLKDLLKKEPKNHLVFYNLGLVEFGRFEYEKAIDNFNKAISLNDKHNASYSNIGDCYKNLGDYVKAEKAYRKACDIKGDEFSLMNLADIELKLGKIEEADKIYGKIMAKLQDNSEALVGLAQIRLAQGKSNEAMSLANKALRKGSHSEASYIKAVVLIENKMYSEALEEIGKVLSDSPGDPKYILTRALAEVRNMDFTKGIDDANAVLTAIPDSIEARLIIAEAFLATSATSEAIDQLDIVDEKGPNGESYRLRGKLAMVSGDTENAKKYYANFYESLGYKPSCALEYAEFLSSIGDNTAVEIANMIIKNYPETTASEDAKALLVRLGHTEEATAESPASKPAPKKNSDKKYRPGKEKY